VRVRDVGDPITNRFTGSVLQCARSAGHGNDRRSHQAHAEDVERLPPHVFLAHVDDTFQTETRAHGCGRDSVLPCSRLRNDARLLHAARKQNLTNRIVDLVRAGVVEVFALEQHARANALGQSRRFTQRRRTPHVVREQLGKLSAKRRIDLRRGIRLLELLQRRNERLRYVLAPEGTEPIRRMYRRAHTAAPLPRAAAMNARTRW
jgi:hypothetical protein